MLLEGELLETITTRGNFLDIRLTGSALCILKAFYLKPDTMKEFHMMNDQLASIIAMCKSADKQLRRRDAQTIPDSRLSSFG